MRMIRQTRQKRVFYAKNINMSWSFDSLAKLASKLLGAELEVGDVLICDNHRMDKRKMLQMTKEGFMIYYGRIHEKTFEPLAEKDGQVKRLNQEIL